MFSRSRFNGAIQGNQLPMRRGQINLLFLHGGADIAGDVEVVTFLGDAIHRDALGVARLFAALLVGGDDLVDVVLGEHVLALALFEVLGGVDE